MTLPARDDLDPCTIEVVHVGDDVFVEPLARSASARGMIKNRAKAKPEAGAPLAS